MSRSLWANTAVAVYSICFLIRSPSVDGCLELGLDTGGRAFIFDSYIRDHLGKLTRGWEALKKAIGVGAKEDKE